MPRKTLVGTVTSDKMQKTLVVSADRRYMERRTGKIVGTRKKFKVHCEEPGIKVGDTVEFVESRPYSKDKNFRFLRLIKKAAELGQVREDA